MAALDLNYRGKLKSLAAVSRANNNADNNNDNTVANGSNDAPITVAPPTKPLGSNNDPTKMLAVKEDSQSEENRNTAGDTIQGTGNDDADSGGLR